VLLWIVDTALRYAKERIQFDKPIAGTQLQQKKLAEMITEITKAQLLTWRLGVLKMREERQLLKSLWPKETMSTWQLTLHVKQDKY
jgi:alkylation response protein AidB-like acyl-CoA dehydrogenase